LSFHARIALEPTVVFPHRATYRRCITRFGRFLWPGAEKRFWGGLHDGHVSPRLSLGKGQHFVITLGYALVDVR
jgi:hypothetical protein